MISDRQKLILKAVVEDYVEKCNPVGSKALLAKPYLKVSSATIRYDMAALEDLGYLEKTHTSSGRIPSHLGYQFYVEHLMSRNRNLLKYYDEFDKIFENESFSVEEIIKKSVELLSNITGQYCVLLGSSANYANVKKMEIVPISETDAVLLIVTDLGQVQSQVIRIPEYARMEDLSKIISTFDYIMYDRSINEIQKTLMKEAMKPRIRQIVNFRDDVLNFLIKGFSRFQDTESFSAGLSNLINQPEFQDHASVQNIIRMVDEETLKTIITNNTSAMVIRIGSENDSEYLKNSTVIIAPYYFDFDGYGCLALVGPCRMKYDKIIPLVEYVSKSMSKLF